MSREVAEKISIARDKKGLTQDKMAEKLGISLRQYNKYESGVFPKFKSQQVKKIDAILGTKAYHLLYEQNVLHGTDSNPPGDDVYPDALRLLSNIGIEVLAHARYQTKMMAEMWAKANGVPSVKTIHDAEKMVADEAKSIRVELKRES